MNHQIFQIKWQITFNFSDNQCHDTTIKSMGRYSISFFYHERSLEATYFTTADAMSQMKRIMFYLGFVLCFIIPTNITPSNKFSIHSYVNIIHSICTDPYRTAYKTYIWACSCLIVLVIIVHDAVKVPVSGVLF